MLPARGWNAGPLVRGRSQQLRNLRALALLNRVIFCVWVGGGDLGCFQVLVGGRQKYLPIKQAEVGLEVRVVGGSSTFYPLYMTHTGEKGDIREKKKVGPHFWFQIPLGNQTAQPHARTNETKRHDFPVGLAPSTSDEYDVQMGFCGAGW